MADAKKKKRPWNRNVRHTHMPAEGPNCVLIAGEDFKAGPEHQHLVDMPSRVREALDEDFLRVLAERGAFITLDCTAMEVPGYEGPQCIVVNGRRTLRHVREVNRRRAADNLPAFQVRVNLIANTSALDLEILSRLLNHPGMEDTDAQRVGYVRRLHQQGIADADVARILNIKQSKLATYRKIGDAFTTNEVLEALDEGVINLSAAANLCAQEAQVQRDAIAKLRKGDKPATVQAARKAVNAVSDKSVFAIKPSVKDFERIATAEVLSDRELALLDWAIRGRRDKLPPDITKWLREQDA